MKTIDNVYSFLLERGKQLETQLRSKGIDLSDVSCLRNVVHAVDGVTLAYNADDLGIPKPVIDTKRMSARFRISTHSKDRMGDIVLPRGCLPTIDNYRRNPRVFFSHRSTDLPLGSARDPESKELLVWVGEDYIDSECVFHGKTAESNIIFDLVACGELQTASIGFLPIVGAVLEVEKAANRAETNEHGEDLVYFGDGSSWFPSLRFHQWDLTEWSIVPIPANAECLSQHLSRGHVRGEVITPLLRKSLEPFALPTKAWSPGYTPEVMEKLQLTELIYTPLDKEILEANLEVQAKVLEKIDTMQEEEKLQPSEQIANREIVYDVDTSSFKWKDTGTILITLDQFSELLGVGRTNKLFGTLYSGEDVEFMIKGGILHIEGEYYQRSTRDQFIKLLEGFNGDLVPPPTQKEEEQQVTPILSPDDKYKNWPVGAKLLDMSKDHIGVWSCMLTDHECVLEPDSKVRKYAIRKKERLVKELNKLLTLGNKLYPEKFQSPHTDPEEESTTNLVDGPVKSLTDTDWNLILSKLESISSKQEQQDEKFYELTGQ